MSAMSSPSSTTKSQSLEDNITLLPASSQRRRCTSTQLPTIVLLLCLSIVGVTAATSLPATHATLPNHASPPARNYNYTRSTGVVYLGNGCFWERQWAYVGIEKDANGPFKRAASNVTSVVGYAGGSDYAQVCYHSGQAHDYGPLGHAEAVRVTLDAVNAVAQFEALATNFFASFVGPPGARSRPDAGDRGTPYRSIAGLPGGMSSPLYPILVQMNGPWRMDLKLGQGGTHDADEPNTVWVYDSDRYNFYAGEVYHQFHCNFFQSEGMPYPDSYTVDLWNLQQSTGQIQPTGCPEDGNHAPCGSGWHWGRR